MKPHGRIDRSSSVSHCHLCLLCVPLSQPPHPASYALFRQKHIRKSLQVRFLPSPDFPHLIPHLASVLFQVLLSFCFMLLSNGWDCSHFLFHFYFFPFLAFINWMFSPSFGSWDSNGGTSPHVVGHVRCVGHVNILEILWCWRKVFIWWAFLQMRIWKVISWPTELERIWNNIEKGYEVLRLDIVFRRADNRDCSLPLLWKHQPS